MESPIVTLTTDWGTKDFFAGMVKGKLHRYIPNVRVVDITHDLVPFDLRHAIFVVKNGCMDFPAGTIHIIDVDSVETQRNAFVVVEYKEQYFICCDNGLPGAVFGNDFTSVTQLNVFQESNFFTFAAYDLFCKVAALLADNAPLSELGPQVDRLNLATTLEPIISEDGIRAHIIYIDGYGNAYLDIKYNDFAKLCNHRRFKMRVNEFEIHEISNSYIDTKDVGSRRAEMLLTVSATGHLQIAFKRASSQQLLGLNLMDSIFFTFQN